MNCSASSFDLSSPASSSLYPFALLFHAFSLIPVSQYFLAFVIISFIFLYNLFEFHFFRDLFSGFRGTSIALTFHHSSLIYNKVVSHCKILHGRYWATPWLSNPHFQTCFLNFFGRPPVFSYRRQIYYASDGGTIALDWLMHSDVSKGEGGVIMNNAIPKDDTTPIVVLIPGLTSDSAASYVKLLVFHMAKRGWNVVVSNHRGLGGVSITSDVFYNAGWTEDIRVVINYLHHEFPKAPLFAVGTSIGANVLVKYLGEDGERTYVAGAAAICNPWDLVIGDRFICRRQFQKFYGRAIAFGLQGYAKLHQSHFTRLANWDGIKKSRSIRDFDNHATCLVGKFETVDTYYRRCSSSYYVGNVSVPLLCISSLDDPICTREAIPWDECRGNKNIVMATTTNGGHLAFFEGLSAASLWWVRAVDEYFGVLHTSPYMHVQKEELNDRKHSFEGTSIDQGPYLNITQDGMVAAMSGEQTKMISAVGQQDHQAEETISETVQSSEKHKIMDNVVEFPDVIAPIKRCVNQISRKPRSSIWWIAFIAVVTSWPFLGPVLIVYRRKLKSMFQSSLLRR